MPDTEPDQFWRAAQQMVMEFGQQAPTLCRKRAAAQKDTGGEMAWEKIAEAAESLLKNGPPFDGLEMTD
jgi:hypothetical protein